jgi:uncharacterized repeat protein (TIGR03803 family)
MQTSVSTAAGRLVRLFLTIAVWALPGSAQSLTTLYSFTGGGNGANPGFGVIFGTNGDLFGTTPYGGSQGYGTVFELTPGTPWGQTVLYSFLGGNDGIAPQAPLTLGTNGVLYGTTSGGGTSGNGTVFQLTPPKVSGETWTESVLYNFMGGSDGSGPQGKLVLIPNGTLYGTTTGGGIGTSKPFCQGCGTVFALAPPAGGIGPWTEKVIYTFSGGKNGSGPQGGVILNKGTLYGTTCCGTVGGLVFKLTPPKDSGNWTAVDLFGFSAFKIGAFPFGSLSIDANGVLYGTTTAGGASNAGIVFSLTPGAAGKPYTLTTIHSFTNGADGGAPYAGPTLDNGVLYVPVTAGCTYGVGGVAQFTPPAGGTGPWTETVLYNFTGGTDGSQPDGGLILGGNNTLYGTTAFDGKGYGTVFELTP